MASGRVVVHVRIASVSGLAECRICGTLTSFDRKIEALEGLDALPCSVCGGNADPTEGTLSYGFEVTR